ncbi:PHP domain-containing protein [Marinitoga arctica]
MTEYYGNFHIHTVISPCADITMSPDIFLEYLNGINWISITDHNTAKHVRIYSKILEKIDVKVIPGIEVTTKEEVHVLIYFEKISEVEEFGDIIEKKLIIKDYNPEKLGYQILCNDMGEFKEIINSPYLGSAVSLSITEIYNLSKKYNSLFIPAHIFRFNGLVTNLGFPPQNINIDAVELKNNEEIKKAKKLGFNNFLFNTDAHFPEQLISSCKIKVKKRDFNNFKKAIFERKVIPIWQR